MDHTISLPALNYGNHGDIRHEYKYADDIVNKHNWKNNLNNFSDTVNKYIDERDTFSDISTKSLREIGIPISKASDTTMDIFQTLSGDILNNYVFINIGKIIKYQYEHFSKIRGLPIISGDPVPGSVQKTNYLDIDKIPNEVSDNLIEMSSLINNLSSNLSRLVSQDSIEFHTKFIKDNDIKAGRLVSENPDLSKYGLYPEVIGTDIANLTSGTTDMTSVAFTSGGLFGWKYVTPEQRTIGSAADFGSILMDILYKLIYNQKLGVKKQIADDVNENFNYIFNKITHYYEPLLTSDIIGNLSKINEDIGTDPDNVPTDRNPFVLGIKKDTYRTPDVYALWCIYRSIRTPFYTRDIITEQITLNNDELNKIFEFDIEISGANIIFKPKTLIYDSGITDKIKKAIIKVLESENEKKQSPLSLQLNDIVTQYNVPLTATVSLADNSIKIDIIKKLKELSMTAWFNIITQSFTLLYLNLFIAATIDWKNITNNFSMDGINIPQNILTYDVSILHSRTVEHNVTFNDYLNLVKTANKKFIIYRNTINSYLGTTNQNPMGGTSLIGTNSISIQRYGTIISYPGDTNILESVSEYMKMLLSDINSVEKRLNEALDNMSNMYWYRDVLKWLELLFTIFKPNDVPNGITLSGSEIKLRFYQLEKILKILYSKQLNIMTSYIQKSKILQKRYEISTKIDTSLEKQIKATSYYTHSTICYIKRQIIIIYYLLDKTLESWWTTAPISSSRKRRQVIPAFLESEFKPAYRIMKSGLFEWFRDQVSKLTSTILEPEMLKEIRTLGKDLCDSDNSNSLIQKTPSNVYLTNKAITTIRTDSRFWLLLIANLKNKNISNISSKPEELQRLYIPVYENSGSKRKYYLFDIMPLVLKGNYKGQFGKMSSPQWMTAKDIENTKFTKNNSGIIILANSPNEVAQHNNWQSIAIEWLNNLVSSSEKVASEQSNPDKKLWFIRTGISVLLHSQDIYNSPVLKKEQFGSMDVDDIDDKSKIILLLQKYQEYTNINRETNNKYLILVSREYIKNEMNNSSIQFQTI
jgi:hypothetical protein